MAATKQDVIDYIASTPLAEMSDVLTIFADKAYKHRLGSRGYVPAEVFEQLLGPVTVSVQIVHMVLGKNLCDTSFALRLREESEVGDAYRGKFHNVCTSLRWGDDLRSALHRNDQDAFDGAVEHPWEYLGVTYHHEAARRNMDLTFMHLRRMWGDDVKRLKGNWKIFTWKEIEEMMGKSPEEIPIVESNLHQLLWVMNSGRTRFGVLKETFPPELLA